MRALITATANMTGRIVGAIIGGSMTVVTAGTVVTVLTVPVVAPPPDTAVAPSTTVCNKDGPVPKRDPAIRCFPKMLHE